MQETLHLQVKNSALHINSWRSCTLNPMILLKCIASCEIPNGKWYRIRSAFFSMFTVRKIPDLYMIDLVWGNSKNWIWKKVLQAYHTREFCFWSKTGKDHGLMRLPGLQNTMFWGQLQCRWVGPLYTGYQHKAHCVHIRMRTCKT